MNGLLLFFTSYLPFQIALNPMAGVDLASIRILAIGIFIFWLIRSFKKIKIIFSSTWLPWFIVIFCLISAFSLIFAENTDWGLRKLAFLLSFFPLYFVFFDTTFEARVKVIRCLIWSATILAAVGIIQFAAQFFVTLDGIYPFWKKEVLPIFLGKNVSQTVTAYPSFLVNISGHTIFRAVGFFPDPHMFSLFLGMVFPLALFNSFKKKIHYFPALIILAAVLLSFSRGSYVAILSGVLLLIALTINKNNFFKERLIIWSSALIILASFVFIPFTSQRFASTFDLSDTSNEGRLEMWKKSFSVGTKHWFSGVGLGNYPLSVKPDAGYREPIYAHNLYLDIFSETGMFNVLVFISLIAIVWLKYWKRSRQNIFYLAPAASLFIFIVHSFFETALFSVHILPLFIMLIAFSHDSKN